MFFHLENSFERGNIRDLPMTGFFDQHYSPSLTKPIMIVGLQGTSDLGYRCTRKLVRTLGARRFAEYYSECFPDIALVNRRGLCSLPRWTFYEQSRVNPQLVMLCGSAELASQQPEDYYSTFHQIAEFSKTLGVRMTYVLDGTMTGEAIESTIRVAATRPVLLRRAQRYGAGILRRDSLPPVPGLLIGFHRFYGSPAMLILGSIEPTLRDGENVDVLLNFLRKFVRLKS